MIELLLVSVSIIYVIFFVLIMKDNSAKSKKEFDIKEFDIKEFQKDLFKEQMRAKAAFISPAFRGLYEFQQEYLPKKFYSLGNSLYYKIKEKGFYWILNEFNNGNQITLMNETNSQIDIIDYSELEKVIIKVNVPDIKKVLVTSYSNTISNSIYMCFNLNNEDENMYFTAERSDQIFPANYVLCGRDKDMRHLNYGSLGLDKEPFIEDIPVSVIENMFQISQNTSFDKKDLSKAEEDNLDISKNDIKFVSKKYSEEEIKNLKSELFFANQELDSRNLEKGYLRNSDLYREVSKSTNSKPELLADTFNSFGLEYYHLNNSEKAISFLQKARKIYDSIFEYSNISTYNNLAIIYNEIGNYSESDKICNEAIRINTLKYGNDTKENDRFNEIISENKKLK